MLFVRRYLADTETTKLRIADAKPSETNVNRSIKRKPKKD
jgi:hypothetical protein